MTQWLQTRVCRGISKRVCVEGACRATQGGVGCERGALTNGEGAPARLTTWDGE
jgi:hypothetical protein